MRARRKHPPMALWSRLVLDFAKKGDTDQLSGGGGSPVHPSPGGDGPGATRAGTVARWTRLIAAQLGAWQRQALG